MAPPKCLACGIQDATRLEGQHLMEIWAAQRGVAWDFRKVDGAPYWYLCLECHRREWPLDQRCANRHSKPWSAVVFATTPVRRLLVGDFYLTQPPPERLRAPLFPAATQSRRAGVRSRSPWRLGDFARTDAPLASLPGTAPQLLGCMRGTRLGSKPLEVCLGPPLTAPRLFLRRGRRPIGVAIAT